MEKQLIMAKEIAIEAHKGQKRSDGKNYITHVEAVASSFKLEEDMEYQIVAWLHDVLEDSKLTFKDLLDKGIAYHLARAVVVLTREKDQNYKDYILQVKEDEIATRVKLADLKHNLFTLNNGSLRDKYLLAFYILK